MFGLKKRKVSKEEKKKIKEFEKWKKKHPEEYLMRIEKEKKRRLNEVNKDYLAKGFIKEPYKDYDEMLGDMFKHICEPVTDERLRQDCIKHGLDYEEIRPKRHKITD